ncbi:MAG: 4-amino-4-deoxychorismate lyase [Paracoccaceae bacterium]|jgi:4-amino-4-deoxychorismate lyase
MESPFRATDVTLQGPNFALIETLRWTGQELSRLDLHLARLQRGVQALGWQVDIRHAENLLKNAVSPQKPARLRLTCLATGELKVSASEMPAAKAKWRCALSPLVLDESDPFLTIKSTHRPLYEAARQNMPADLDEVILTNTRGEVCDGTITTLFFDHGAGMCTPPLTSGLLPGILRQDLLNQGLCSEAVLLAQDLPHVLLWLGNALRGLITAEFN